MSTYRRVDLILAVGLAVFGFAIVVLAAVAIPPAASAYTFDPIGPRGFAFVIGTFTTLLGVALIAERVLALRRASALPSADPTRRPLRRPRRAATTRATPGRPGGPSRSCSGRSSTRCCSPASGT